MNTRPLFTIALILATAACSGDNTSTTDASVDAAKDATGKEASVIDSGPADVTVDDAPAGPTIDPVCNIAAQDAGAPDAASDAASDAAADADMDAAMDGGVADGGGTDSGGGGGSGGACVTIDDAGILCNPITNYPCKADAGEACDFSQNGFQCYPPPPDNTAALCASCDVQNGPACLPTSTCLPTANGNECARYCCDDSDCGNGHCDKTTFGSDPIGFCVK
jgi:hypothetical protein